MPSNININVKSGDRFAVVYELVRPVIDGETWYDLRDGESKVLANKRGTKWIGIQVMHDGSKRGEILLCFDQEFSMDEMRDKAIKNLMHKETDYA